MKKLSRVLAFGLIVGLATSASASEICEKSLSDKYTIAVTELARGFLAYEKMKVEGSASQAVMIVLEDELAIKRTELSQHFGKEKFEEILSAAILSESGIEAKKEIVKKENRQNAIEEESVFLQAWFGVRDLKGHTKSVTVVDYSPDGQFIVTGSEDGSVKVWNAQTAELIHSLFNPTGSAVHTVQFSPDGSTVLVGSFDGLRFWSYQTQEPPIIIPNDKGLISAIRFSRDGKLVAIAKADRTIRVLDAKTQKQIKEFKDQFDAVSSLEFSPDSKSLLVAYASNAVKILAFKSGAKSESFVIPQVTTLNSASFSPNAKLIVLATEGSRALIVDASSGIVLHTLEGHEGSVTSAHFSPDGRLVATTSNDVSIRIWTASSGKELFKLTDQHENMIYSSKFHPNGRELVSVSADNTAVIWQQGIGEE